MPKAVCQVPDNRPADYMTKLVPYLSDEVIERDAAALLAVHRHLFAKDPAQAFLFGGRAAPSFVCRSSDAMKREEWQANFAASCGLMPRNSVIETWRERFGDTNARILKRKNRINLPSDASGEMAEVCRSINEQRDVEAMNEFVRPFAEKFLVSMVAMRIRLERLGLLQREVPRQRSLAVGV
jgi:hypothetical protein